MCCTVNTTLCAWMSSISLMLVFFFFAQAACKNALKVLSKNQVFTGN